MSHLVRPKDALETTKQDGVVYKIPCECGKVYIGETGRVMQDRIKENDRDVRLARTQTSAVSEHANKTGHLPIWKEVKFIDRDPHWTSKTLGLLRRHLKHCTPKVKEIAYKSLLRPQLEYCSSVWDPYEKGDVATLEKVQRMAARLVKGDYKRESSVTQMICDLGWQSLEARRALSRLSLMYKIAHGLVDVESQILVRSGRATRQSQGQHYRNILALKS